MLSPNGIKGGRAAGERDDVDGLGDGDIDDVVDVDTGESDDDAFGDAPAFTFIRGTKGVPWCCSVNFNIFDAPSVAFGAADDVDCETIPVVPSVVETPALLCASDAREVVVVLLLGGKTSCEVVGAVVGEVLLPPSVESLAGKSSRNGVSCAELASRFNRLPVSTAERLNILIVLRIYILLNFAKLFLRIK